MGLFSFIKDAGKKIFKTNDEEMAANPNVQPDVIAQNQKEAVKRYIEQVGLNISQFDFTLDGNGKLTLTGECATQADYEKVALTAGNIAGVAEVDNNMTVTSPIAAEEVKPTTYHTVEKGNTLWKIAETNYQDGSKYALIFEANKPMIKDADEIYPGQVLRIPALA
ncbi:MAG: peptidoglycan-binding protein LysM [Bacteroidetes bacterium]|nr:peptidoglycan-binding protein LysM [Bacteroidota bacterium]